MDTTLLYFFSAFAQVWAALVAFGGAFLMRRSDRYEQQMNEYLQKIHSNLWEIREWLITGKVNSFSMEIFEKRRELEQFLESWNVADEKRSLASSSRNHFPLPILSRATQYFGRESTKEFGGSDHAQFIIDCIENAFLYFGPYKERRDRRIEIDGYIRKLIVIGDILIGAGLSGTLLVQKIATSGCLITASVLVCLGSSVVGFYWICKGFMRDNKKRPDAVVG